MVHALITEKNMHSFDESQIIRKSIRDPMSLRFMVGILQCAPVGALATGKVSSYRKSAFALNKGAY
jgi:hypothetical protein